MNSTNSANLVPPPAPKKPRPPRKFGNGTVPKFTLEPTVSPAPEYRLYDQSDHDVHDVQRTNGNDQVPDA